MLIRDVMTAPATTVKADTTIREALTLLDRERITILPVVGARGELMGVVSEADLMAEALTLGVGGTMLRLEPSPTGPAHRVGEVMTLMVTTVRADANLDEAVDLLTTTMLKSLPVIEDGRVAGVISRSDVIHLLASRDQRLRAEVAELLRDESPDWLVEVSDGVVVVTGPVDEHQRRLAAVLAGSITGVQAVKVR